MNIKRIIREEIDNSFNWLSDEEFDIDKIKIGSVFEIVNNAIKKDRFTVDGFKWNEKIPELSLVYVSGQDGSERVWKNNFYIKTILDYLKKGELKKIN